MMGGLEDGPWRRGRMIAEGSLLYHCTLLSLALSITGLQGIAAVDLTLCPVPLSWGGTAAAATSA